MAKSQVRTQIVLDPALYERILAHKERTGESMSSVLRRGVEAYLAQQEQTKAEESA